VRGDKEQVTELMSTQGRIAARWKVIELVDLFHVLSAYVQADFTRRRATAMGREKASHATGLEISASGIGKIGWRERK
jgi:hypothetical protein